MMTIPWDETIWDCSKRKKVSLDYTEEGKGVGRDYPEGGEEDQLGLSRGKGRVACLLAKEG